MRIVLRRVSFCELITILFRGGFFLTNNNSKFSLIILSTKQIISYIVIIKELIKRATNINIDIGFILFSDIKYLFNLNSALRLKSLRSSNKEKILAYTRS